MRILLLVALLDCHPKEAVPRRRQVDATAFRQLLADEPGRLASLEIVPLGRNTARYIVHPAQGAETEVDAEYPGRLVDAIARAKVPYTVSPPVTLEDWPHSERAMDELSISAFHSALTTKDTAMEIELVFIEPLEGGNARYLVRWKSRPRRAVVIAPFPGPLIDELVAAGIPYGVQLHHD